jgi:hypothetical protein
LKYERENLNLLTEGYDKQIQEQIQVVNKMFNKMMQHLKKGNTKDAMWEAGQLCHGNGEIGTLKHYLKETMPKRELPDIKFSGQDETGLRGKAADFKDPEKWSDMKLKEEIQYI